MKRRLRQEGMGDLPVAPGSMPLGDETYVAWSPTVGLNNSIYPSGKEQIGFFGSDQLFASSADANRERYAQEDSTERNIEESE